MLELVRPKYFIPVHGEYRHLVLHARLARDTNVPEDNTFVLEDGQVMEFGRFDHSAGEIVARPGERMQAGQFSSTVWALAMWAMSCWRPQPP